MKAAKLLCAAGLLALTGMAQAQEKVVVYNWTEYVPDGVLDQFTEETGIAVEYATFDSNEVMYSKLKLQKGAGYDVIVPSAYFISKMAKEGLLHEIDHSKLTNLKHLDADILDKPYDPKNTYSIPYVWGSTAIGVNADEIDPATITSWKDLWDPKWQRSLLLTNDVREVFHMALRINGHSGNSTDPEEIKQAYELLRSLMPNVLVFNSDAPREPFLAGDVNLGMLWNGEAFMAQQEEEAIQYIYPKEGAALWVDSFAIPVNAANVENAHKFIDFMMRPEIAVQVVEYLGYTTPNETAIGMLDPEYSENTAIFPPEEVVKQGEFQQDVGDEALAIYIKYWEMLKTGN
ncbi:extracellular solute-binding protein family 1 [Ferrimonas balearica DSM 9799]|uniref:Putrescine-binding periplasmic protein n=1 Tax=Ferrimonas balearica (strain DSM 9799 / CCM 4581 / KCTC 23876 / PAT) TaxID=550540 RepID=E1SWB3_FERBD|nr:extracellular solute-binding protein [Ferrimonas balearica]ADN75402.1 extracellular solute-binding protein family 1 [Ferrimonas balearica DSM 9799]MBY5979059.1 extracellular solute-binding protein [Ferrimonas balearica]MBY6018397.1 extracellular solute-binding protein [Halomonas denitrificans]MBY6094749.1 extracellular solute-binding protein [Ferrimonas balearica]